MKTIKVTTVIAASMLALVALTGCGETADAPAQANPDTPATSAPASQAPAPLASPTEAPTPGSRSNGQAEAVFGAEYIGKDGRIVADQAAKMTDILLGNTALVTGKVKPASVLGGILMDAATMAKAKADPTGLVIASFTSAEHGTVGVEARTVEREQMAVTWAVIDPATGASCGGKVLAQNGCVLEVAWTGKAEVDYTQAGKTITQPVEVDYRFHWVPSTDTTGDRWVTVGYAVSAPRYAAPAGK